MAGVVGLDAVESVAAAEFDRGVKRRLVQETLHTLMVRRHLHLPSAHKCDTHLAETVECLPRGRFREVLRRFEYRYEAERHVTHYRHRHRQRRLMHTDHPFHVIQVGPQLVHLDKQV